MGVKDYSEEVVRFLSGQVSGTLEIEVTEDVSNADIAKLALAISVLSSHYPCWPASLDNIRFVKGLSLETLPYRLAQTGEFHWSQPSITVVEL